MTRKLDGVVQRPNDTYTICCILCHTAENLGMIAHRTLEGLMVGWIFACYRCADKVCGRNIVLEVEEDNEKT